MGGLLPGLRRCWRPTSNTWTRCPRKHARLKSLTRLKMHSVIFTAFITRYFRLSYTAIQSDSVKIAKAEITQLRQRNAEILEELSQSKEQATVLNNEKKLT
nr:hypothetical protein [Escherichia coli]